jgi:hypothetical protein
MSPSRAILGAGVWTSSAAKVGLGLLVIVGFWTEGLCKYTMMDIYSKFPPYLGTTFTYP